MNGIDVPFIHLLLLIAGSAAGMSFLLCGLMRAGSPRLGYIDHPGGHKGHAKPMPLGGGVAIMLTMIILIVGGLVAVLGGTYRFVGGFDWFNIHEAGFALRAHQAGGVLLCALILHVLGLFDDIKNFGPWIKLTVQFAAAGLAVVGFGVRVGLFLPVPAIAALVSILWIVVITNAFNFLDNADGLAAGVALICTLVLLVIAATAGQIFVSGYLVCLAGALFGFLLHNFPPARLYLGDAGSLPVGFLLAVGSILTTYYHEQDPSQAKASAFIPLVVMAVPLYDFISVVLLRWLSGASPLAGDHRHFSHRLLRRGLTVRQTVLTIYLACSGTAAAAILLRKVAWPYAVLLFGQTVCIVAIIALLEYQPGNERKT